RLAVLEERAELVPPRLVTRGGGEGDPQGDGRHPGWHGHGAGAMASGGGPGAGRPSRSASTRVTALFAAMSSPASMGIRPKSVTSVAIRIITTAKRRPAKTS